MKDWIYQKLADALNVPPPQAGEAISPRIRFEQPWPQWLLIAVVLGGSALIIWLYRREGKASAFYKYLLAGIRICLLLLLVFMLSEAVLSVAAYGLAVPDHHDRRLGQRADRRPVRAARNPGGSADPGQPGGGPGLALEPSPRAGGRRSGRGRHADRDRQGAGSEGQGSS